MIVVVRLVLFMIVLIVQSLVVRMTVVVIMMIVAMGVPRTECDREHDERAEGKPEHVPAISSACTR